jgi:hypothetical protein
MRFEAVAAQWARGNAMAPVRRLAIAIIPPSNAPLLRMPIFRPGALFLVLQTMTAAKPPGNPERLRGFMGVFTQASKR